jgi:transposase
MEDCRNKHACPYLGFRSCDEVLSAIERLQAENRDLRGVFDTAVKAFKEKENEISALQEENKVLREKFRDLAQRPFARNTATEDDEQDENVSPQPEIPRKKRGAPVGHRGATRRKPNRSPDKTILVHPEQCPHCRSNSITPCQDTEDHYQEDIVIVRPTLTRFIKRRGYCRNCGKTFFPADRNERPKGYIGPVAVATAGCLRYAIKIPFDGVRKILAGLWGLEITQSALVGFDKKLADSGRPCYEHIADMVRYSSDVNVDETSWPCGKLTEWLWTFANRDCTLFKIAPSRAGAVPADVLGEHYGGVLSSDCFSAYNTLEAHAKQKCLAHYERSAKKLEKFYPNSQSVRFFASQVKDIFKRARQAKRDWLAGIISDCQARQWAEDFEAELDQLLEAPLENRDADNLRNRLLTHRDENFTFLRLKGVDPDNNRAERALRPSVVMRKITYGNNSETGARNHEILMSLVETAKLHASKAGRSPLDVMSALASGKDSEGIKQAVFGYWDTS